jgi:hypothetical protein
MNIITEAGANGKASGRLKSYKFREGAQQFDITLPVGDSGDFFCMVTHATDPAMTNGIGVGLQSDGAGNWNLATLSGTTVTVGASSGLTNGKTARIEIEKDITGAYWYYIYDAAGPKPTTATGKLFTALSEGYTGWYANGNSKTYAIENISIRAESIVGRTNVEVTEPFWFRDEATVNALGRYIQTGETGAYSYNGTSMRYLLTTTSNVSNNLTFPKTVKNPSVSVDLYPISSTNQSVGGVLLTSSVPGTWWDYIPGSYAKVEFNQSLGKISMRLYPNLTTLSSTDLGIYVAFSYEDKFTLTMSDDGSTVTATLYNSAGEVLGSLSRDVAIPNCQYVSLTGYPFGVTTSRKIEFDNLQISGTRVYNKPIHRGAMLETYHDGTEKVVGTTFIDDCQWDRSAEYIQANPTSFTFDTVNGVIVETETSDLRSDQLKIKTRFGSAHYHYKFTKIVDATYIGVFTFCDQRETSHTCPIDNPTACPNAELYFVCVNIKPSNTYLQLRRRTVGDTATIGSTEIPTISNGETHTIDILHNAESGNIRVFYDGIQKINITDTTYTSGYCGPTRIYSRSTTVKFSEIQIIAVSPDATNGIAACIPPIGGGGRYGVEESVYNTFTTENVNKGVYLTTAKVKTTNPNADEVSLEGTNDTTSITLNTTPIDVDATYTVKTAPITIDANETDTLRVSVKNSTTCNQSTNYVDSLSLIPVSGDDVLYPQDLAFISGVKPSQKRKVEVK